MKAIVTALALAALIGTPALAQTSGQPVKQQRVHVQQTNPQIQTNPQVQAKKAADPDVFIRDMLRSDSPDNSAD